MDELLRDFLVETCEHVDAAGAQLVRLERDPTDREMISGVFRLLHTIKGTCGFLGLARLAKLSHAAEALLGRLREGTPATPETITLILAAMDRIRYILAEIETQSAEPGGDDEDLIEALAAHTEGPLSQQKSPAQLRREAENAALAATGSFDRNGSGSNPLAGRSQEETEAPSPLVEIQNLKPAAARAAPRDDDSARAESDPARKGAAPSTIRVAVDALENVMLLVSELVLTRNQLVEVTRLHNDESIKGALQRLSSVATDLQDSVMRARMQPIGRVLGALPRLARELGVELGKRIDLIAEGSDTELDRQLIELIRDPLTHMIRNCADHGLESPAERIAAGKPETGTIRVTAAHDAGQITIEVVDDGRGLDVQRIRAKAVSAGLVSEAEIALMSGEDICRFIFAPGFSTARQVTNISGRGVGLDVVRENIESIGGAVSVASTQGQGTRFVIRVPLTLAIAPALIVMVAGQRFALPQLGVVEVVAIGPDTPHKLETVQGSLILRLRDDVLPVANLGDVLCLEPPSAPAAGAEQLVIVMRMGTASYGVIVDSVDDVQEIVVKPLGSLLSHLRIYSGQTILGDGSVVLILDPLGIAGALGFQRTAQYQPPREEKGLPAGSRNRTRIVLFKAGPGASKALPLSLITRIESVQGSEIERVGSGYVIRHRGRLMPLLPVTQGVIPKNEDQPVLVLGIGGESIGLFIDEILDILEEDLEIQMVYDAPGMIGSAEIGGQIAEFLDITYFMQIAHPDALARGVNRRFHILLVDDRLFFRDMLTPVLSAAGYRVTSLSSPTEALDLIARGATFDAVVTDTDMPDMNGYNFARALLARPGLESLPIVALAAQIGDMTQSAADASGISAVCGKFDRSGLVAILAKLLDQGRLGDHSVEELFMAQRIGANPTAGAAV